MSDFDVMLWRPIESGKEFDTLIPKSKCQITYLGEGLTDFSINKMEQMVLDYANQTEQLAVVLKKQQLDSTSLAVHEFLFNHLQYKSDDADQMLRSPACSWYTRKEGIDCKSYSIFASCLLLNMGITHYIRKIKQPGYAPDEFTHVYVIVPIDQTNGTLKKGYYTIDGTIPDMNEPAIIGKSDLKMSGNRHYGLNAAASLNGSVSIASLKNLASQFSINKITSVFGLIGCGRSAVSEDQTKLNLTNIDSYYADWQLRLNTAIQSKSYTALSIAVAEFNANSTMFKAAVERKKREGWNPCSTKRLDAVIKTFTFYKDVVGQLIETYVSEYFNKTQGSQTYTATSAISKSKYGFDFQDFGTPETKTLSYANVTAKNVNIPAFTIPQYVVDQANKGNELNLDTFLGLLETAAPILLNLTSSGTNNGGSNGGSTGQFNTGSYTLADNQPSKMGAGAIVGTIVVLGGLTYAFTQGKTNNK